MSLTKPTAAGIALASLLILGVGAGAYLNGRSSELAERAQSATAGASERGIAEPRERVGNGRIERILRTAADHYAVFRQDERENLGSADKGKHEISKLRTEWMGDALAVLPTLELDEPIRRHLAWEIYAHWGRKRGAEAADFALASATGDSPNLEVTNALSSALWGWAESAPADAYRWSRENLEKSAGALGVEARQGITRNLMREWAKADLAAAFDELRALPYDDQRDIADKLGNLWSSPDALNAYLAEVAKFPEGKVRSQLLDPAVSDLRQYLPAHAEAYLDAHGIEYEPSEKSKP